MIDICVYRNEKNIRAIIRSSNFKEREDDSLILLEQLEMTE